MSHTPQARTAPLGQARDDLPSLYLHVPFCERRCDYCAFYTLADTLAPRRARYLDRLEAELAERGGRCAPLQHLYIGGGTPSYLSAAELDRLFGAIHAHLRFAPHYEWSMEANPLSVDAAKFDRLLDAGVTRISMGVQSFNDRVRRAIGRHGDAAEVLRAVELLQARGVRNYNLDLIYGAPGQTLAELELDLERFLELDPAHVSTYSLMVEPGTPLARRGAQEADDALLADMWALIGERLAAAGLQRYEVSNHARPGHECRHNTHVWQGGAFMGIGPSAAWYDGASRWTNPADLDLWLAGRAPLEDRLEPQARAREILAYGFRTAAGWTPAAFRAATGYDLQALAGDRLAALVDEGMLEAAGDALRIPAARLILADYVARELI